MKNEQDMSNCDHSAGFTLVELVLVVLILGLISGIFAAVFSEGNHMFDTVDARRELTQEGRMALLRIVRETRQVRSSSDVVGADIDTFSFYGVNDSLYTIEFSGISGGDVTFRRGAVIQTLASGVDSMAFGYYQSDGNLAVPIVSPGATDIFRITIFLRLVNGGITVALQTGTYLRNI